MFGRKKTESIKCLMFECGWCRDKFKPNTIGINLCIRCFELNCNITKVLTRKKAEELRELIEHMKNDFNETLEDKIKELSYCFYDEALKVDKRKKEKRFRDYKKLGIVK